MKTAKMGKSGGQAGTKLWKEERRLFLLTVFFLPNFPLFVSVRAADLLHLLLLDYVIKVQNRRFEHHDQVTQSRVYKYKTTIHCKSLKRS